MSSLLSGKEALAQMNKDYVVAKIGGKVRIVSWETKDAGGGRTHKIVTFSSVADIKALLSNRFYGVKHVDTEGNETITRKPLFDYWNKHKDRPTAIGFTIDPGGERFVGDRLNLWQGFGVQAKQGDWSLLRHHIDDVVCSGNADHAGYLLRYLAYAIQNPTVQSEVIVILRGKQGTGKGTLATLMCDIFGAHGLHVTQSRQVVGGFNAHLMQCCFIFADEAVWAGDQKAAGVLKSMATERSMMFEPKGIDAYSGPNMLTVVMASNEDWVAPVDEDDRRYVVFEVSDAHAKDTAYFGRLHKELDGGGREAFLHDMLAMDLAGWHPRDNPPETQAKNEQKAESADPLVEWLGNILAEGSLPYQVRDPSGVIQIVAHKSDPALARADRLRIHAMAHSGRKYLKSHDFWRFLDEHGIISDDKARTSGARYRRFLPLPEARKRFSDLHPWWKPFEDSKADWHMSEEAQEAAAELAGIDTAVGRADMEEEPFGD
ncbi:MAG: hypothetical protein KF861_02080 [Planctomycetaceae bacterium]|nr:hypothetical protein [Planctomycetaceae bacterium]